MSVLIKGKMPEKCFQCVAYDIGSTSCLLFSNGIPARYSLSAREKPDWCELVELPPHGRLIDADALAKSIKDQIELIKQFRNEELDRVAQIIEAGYLQEIANASTILEAEVEE